MFTLTFSLDSVAWYALSANLLALSGATPK
jgi:hypothetical protein